MKRLLRDLCNLIRAWWRVDRIRVPVRNSEHDARPPNA